MKIDFSLLFHLNGAVRLERDPSGSGRRHQCVVLVECYESQSRLENEKKRQKSKPFSPGNDGDENDDRRIPFLMDRLIRATKETLSAV